MKPVGDEAFSLSQIGEDGQLQSVIDPDWKIGSILPAKVRTYFFFDGEKIDNFARPGHEKEVREAVRNVLKIEAIERAKRHLDDVAKEYQAELKRHTSGKLKELMDQTEAQGEKRDKLLKNSEELQKEVTAARQQQQDIDVRLNEIGSSRELSAKRSAIQNELEELQAQEVELWSEIREVANRAFICLAEPALDAAMVILEGKRERREIPSGIRETFLRDLLDQMRCICGRPIHDASEEHRNLRNRLNHSVSSRLEDAVLETTGDLKRFIPHIGEIPNQVIALMNNRRSLNDEIESKEGHLTEISNQLTGFDETEVSKLERSRREREGNIRRLEAEINRALGGIGQIDKELAELKERVKREKAFGKKGGAVATLLYARKCFRGSGGKNLRTLRP